MLSGIRKIHRYLSLTLAALWLLQALTGTILVFHREIDSWLIGAPDVARDGAALDAALARLQKAHPGATIPFIYAADGAFDQLDVYLRDAGGDYEVHRLDGQGRVLRSLPSNPERLDAGIFEILLEFHKSLLADEAGEIFLGASGIFLLTNIGLGLRLAWPRARQWRQALTFPKPELNQRFAYGLHRALGLWVAMPAMVVVTAGALMIWDDYVEDWFGGAITPPAVEPVDQLPDPLPVTPSAAIARALAEFPGSRFSVLNPPRNDAPYYKVRVAQPGELRKIYGHTVVYVDARDGVILGRHDALNAAPFRAASSAFYPIHNGEAWGIPGRVVTFLVGLWLIAMIILGLILWTRRRKPRRRSA